MIRVSEIPLVLLLFFTLVYSTIGDPDSCIWSGLYFLVNYIILLLLFNQNKSPIIRKTGISLSISILIFIILKYFIGVDYTRYYNIIPFTICLVSIIIIERRWQKLKKN